MSIDSTTANSKGGGDFKPVPAGNHPAICIGVLDMGTHESNFNGEVKSIHKIRLVFETPFAKMDDGRPFTTGESLTFSLHAKAGFRKHLESWRGKPFAEGEPFVPKNLLGKMAMLNIVHKPKAQGDGVWTNITSITPLPKHPQTGAPLYEMPEPVNSLRYLSLSTATFDRAVFDSLGQKMREFIAKSPEFKAMFPNGLWPKPENGQGSRPQGAPPSDNSGEPNWPAEPQGAPSGFDDDIPF